MRLGSFLTYCLGSFDWSITVIIFFLFLLLLFVALFCLISYSLQFFTQFLFLFHSLFLEALSWSIGEENDIMKKRKGEREGRKRRERGGAKEKEKEESKREERERENQRLPDLFNIPLPSCSFIFRNWALTQSTVSIDDLCSPSNNITQQQHRYHQQQWSVLSVITTATNAYQSVLKR